MTANETWVLHLQQTRSRSIRFWEKLENDFLHFRPCKNQRSVIEIVRHVLEQEFQQLQLLQSPFAAITQASPFAFVPFADVAQELKIAQPYHEKLLQHIYKTNGTEFNSPELNTCRNRQVVNVSVFLSNMAQYESECFGLLQHYYALFSTEQNVAA